MFNWLKSLRKGSRIPQDEPEKGKRPNPRQAAPEAGKRAENGRKNVSRETMPGKPVQHVVSALTEIPGRIIEIGYRFCDMRPMFVSAIKKAPFGRGYIAILDREYGVSLDGDSFDASYKAMARDQHRRVLDAFLECREKGYSGDQVARLDRALAEMLQEEARL